MELSSSVQAPAPEAPAAAGIERAQSPALVLDADALDANISATLLLLGLEPDRWRPHLKTAKLAFTMRRLVERGVRRAKVATPLELEAACECGFEDVVLAYPAVGPEVEATIALAARYPGVRVSALVESVSGVEAWRGGTVALYVDLNPGMDRTGASVFRTEEVEAIVRQIRAADLEFAGLHFYDGHASSFPAAEMGKRVHQGYDRLFTLVEALDAKVLKVPEVITAGTPAFPHALGYRRFLDKGIKHRLSPGTVVYNDARSLGQLPAEAGYKPAVFVVSRVVSHPTPTRFTCDAGHKSVSADAGDPTCVVVGHPAFRPGHPSEEHLPVDVSAGTPLPDRGELLWLLPKHVCPTVNNFDHAIIVSGGKVQGVERVTARGRHAPLPVERQKDAKARAARAADR